MSFDQRLEDARLLLGVNPPNNRLIQLAKRVVRDDLDAAIVVERFEGTYAQAAVNIWIGKHQATGCQATYSIPEWRSARRYWAIWLVAEHLRL